MEYLFNRWEEVERALAPGALLLLDYDGTLTPIVERPELAILSSDMKELLKGVSRHYTLGIISGRSLADVRRIVGLGGIYYAGNHGFEISGPNVELVKPEAERVRPILVKLCEELRGKLGNIKGAIVEDKGSTVSVHYRLVAEEEFEHLKNIFEKAVGPHIDSGVVKVTQGKKVFEIRPNVEWDKGKAVLWISGVVDPKGKLMPIYLGDDRTDEDAFSALKEKGVTILVSEGPVESNAKYFVKNVDEVKIFFERLINLRAQK
ncbi:MAG: trehalose-phosphatase [Candidatus Hadarchaeaceae archaeon]